MHTVVETRPYLKDAEKLFSAAERQEIVNTIASNVECGDVMAGTGGYRKIRVGRDGKGKRGGARVIYIQRGEDLPAFLVAVFAKNEKDNLSKEERNALHKLADDLFTRYPRKLGSSISEGTSRR